jgi:LysM repeat protein
MIETDITKQSAWTDERIQRVTADLEAVRAENEALRIRMDDVTDQIASLGGEVSTRLTELAQSDQEVAQQAREATRSANTATQSAGDLEAQREKDREEMLERMNAILEEVLKENERLSARVEHLESSALTFGKVHKVQPGESIASIAAKYGVTAAAIVEANGLPNANLIRVGQELIVPGS